MSIDDEDVNLELALGPTTYSIKKRSKKNSLGAGVNAGSRVNMAFAASDPLTELVWSPINGLSLKRADSSSNDEKPVLLWNVGPSSNYIISKVNEDDDENVVNQGKLSVSEMVVDANDVLLGAKSTLVGPSTGFRTRDLGGNRDDEYNGKSNTLLEEGGETNDALLEKESSTDNAGEDLSRRENVQIDGVDEISNKNAEINTLADAISDCNVDENFETDVRFEPIAINLPEPLDDEATSAALELNTNKTNIPLPIPALPLKKLESSAENDLLNVAAKEICKLQEKGKEKAFSAGYIYERSSNSDDESHESVESCNNSAQSFSRGIKRKSYEHGLVLEPKRMKTMDSSFINWISNLVKGLPDRVREDSSSRALTLACPNDVYERETFTCDKTYNSAGRNTGFQSLFQSLYCGKRNMSSTRAQKENGFREEKLSLENLSESGDGNNDNSCKQIVVSDKEVNPVVVGQPSRPWIFSPEIVSKYGFENCPVKNKEALENLVCDAAKDGVIKAASLGNWMNRTEENPNVPVISTESLWITRFSSRTPKIEKCDEFTREFHDCSSPLCPKVNLDKRVTCSVNAEAPADLKSTSKLSPIMTSEKFRNSEAMSSVLARRLDALRHITPSKRRNSSPCSMKTCLFCGYGHDLRECPDIGKNELEDLVSKTRSFNGIEEFSCVCIRCFRLDHWAISCPYFASTSGNFRSEQNGSFVSPHTTSNFVNNVKYNKMFPLCNNIGTTKNTVVPAGILLAISNLRLSRSDILRWMNTNESLSDLNGFFLRLRLGKSEKELMGSSYYVACITGDAREHKDGPSMKCIVVDVGGIKSSVGSQYVSNHDFLEDEINVWWSRAVDSGCKIPSLDELNSKFNDRISLGL